MKQEQGYVGIKVDILILTVGFTNADLAVDYIYWLLEIRMGEMQKMQSITILKHGNSI